MDCPATASPPVRQSVVSAVARQILMVQSTPTTGKAMSPLRAVCIWGSESSTAKHGITKHAKDWPLSAQLPTRSQLRAPCADSSPTPAALRSGAANILHIIVGWR